MAEHAKAEGAAPGSASSRYPRSSRHVVLPTGVGISSPLDARCLPLCVDLDGTLLRTDTLHEQARRFLLGAPWRAVQLASWLARGRATLKRRLAAASPLDPAALPYDAEFLMHLRAEKARGRVLVLATAADRGIADAVAAHLGLFDEVLASDGERNLKGSAKAEALVGRFGERGFVYAGDSGADLAVWKHAAAGVVVRAADGLRRRMEESGTPAEGVFGAAPSRVRGLLKAMRVYQWVKNLLVFVPLALAHVYDATSIVRCVAMFAAFCATASGIYVLNDLCDLDSDRRHPRKRARPFASGDLPLPFGIAGPLLVLLGLATAAALGTASLAVLAVYVIATTAYSMRLKKYPLVDVFLLAALYTIRLYSGGVASGGHVSMWLLGFSSFLFLSLAFVKRFGEITSAARDGSAHNAARGYLAGDAPMLQMLGVASAFSACLVLSMYMDSKIAREFYAAPGVLWLAVPLHLFWQCRMWLAAARGNMTDDPIVYAARDRVSWLVVALTAAAFVVATLGVPGLAEGAAR